MAMAYAVTSQHLALPSPHLTTHFFTSLKILYFQHIHNPHCPKYNNTMLLLPFPTFIIQGMHQAFLSFFMYIALIDFYKNEQIRSAHVLKFPQMVSGRKPP